MRMLGDLARVLRDAASPMTLIYFPRSTCTGGSDMFGGGTVNFTFRYAPSFSEAATWDGTAKTCTTTAAKPDLMIGATFFSSCSADVLNAKPASIGLLRGPVQAYGFVVPEGQLELAGGAITREEAFFVFSGQGATAGATPWIEPPAPAAPGTPTVYIRGLTTSTLLTLAANVAPELLPPSKWVGFREAGQNDRSTVVINGVANAPAALRSATIGLLGGDLYDRSRNTLDMLAYRTKGQKHAYYPDSTASAMDKRNVRDGHYLPWGYTEYALPVGSDGKPTNPSAARLYSMVSGAEEVRLVSAAGSGAAFDVDALEVVSKAGLIPECAMSVRREADGADLSLYSSPTPCGCFFEQVQDPAVKTDPDWKTRCVSCTKDTECGLGKCRRNYCEVR